MREIMIAALIFGAALAVTGCFPKATLVTMGTEIGLKVAKEAVEEAKEYAEEKIDENNAEMEAKFGTLKRFDTNASGQLGFVESYKAFKQIEAENKLLPPEQQSSKTDMLIYVLFGGGALLSGLYGTRRKWLNSKVKTT